MKPTKEKTDSLDQRELEAVYAISRAVSNLGDTEVILDEIAHLTREVFIFDNIVTPLQKG
jgi:hypothetical protein